MRISDWSSDVCSSDLAPRLAEGGGRGDDAEPRQRDDQPQEAEAKPPARAHRTFHRQSLMRPYWMASYNASPRVSTCSLRLIALIRSEERRVGKEGVRKCKSKGLWSA